MHQKPQPNFSPRKNFTVASFPPLEWLTKTSKLPTIQGEGPWCRLHFLFVLSRFLRKSLATKERCLHVTACFECWNHVVNTGTILVSWFPCYISFCILRKIPKTCTKKTRVFHGTPASCNELWSTYVANAALAEFTLTKNHWFGTLVWLGFPKMAFSKGDEHLQVGSNEVFSATCTNLIHIESALLFWC